MTDKDFDVRIDARDLARLVHSHDIYKRQVMEAYDVINDQRERIAFLSEEAERLAGGGDVTTLSGEPA